MKAGKCTRFATTNDNVKVNDLVSYRVRADKKRLLTKITVAPTLSVLELAWILDGTGLIFTSSECQLSYEYPDTALEASRYKVTDTQDLCSRNIFMGITIEAWHLRTSPAAKLRPVALGPVILHERR